MDAVGTVLVIVWLAMVFTAVIALIFGRLTWLRIRSRKAAALLLIASLPVAVLAGLALPKKTDTKNTAATATSSAATTAPATTAGLPTTSARATPPAATTAAPGTTEPPDTFLTPDANEVGCSDVGGVFVPHGTDGRGDCEPADSRPHCHVPPAQQDDNYVADLIMSPPFPAGTINLGVTRLMLARASNADCWKLPGN